MITQNGHAYQTKHSSVLILRCRALIRGKKKKKKKSKKEGEEDGGDDDAEGGGDGEDGEGADGRAYNRPQGLTIVPFSTLRVRYPRLPRRHSSKATMVM